MMTRNQTMEFELYVMDIAESDKCKTASDFEKLAEELHESVENAIQDMCLDFGVDDYSPAY